MTGERVDKGPKGTKAAPRRGWLGVRVCLLFAFALFGSVFAAAGDELAPKSPTASTAFQDSLTAEERAWLRDHPVISVFQDADWPPIEFRNDRGDASGMSEDYVRLIEQRLGIQLKRVGGLTWEEGFARLARGEIDMTTSVTPTPEREKFWAFTKSYMRAPIVIVTNPEVTYLADMRELGGRRVAVVGGYAAAEWIPRDFPEIQLVPVENVREGLEKVQRGEVFAFIENMLVVDYYIAKLQVSTLKIAGQTPYQNSQSLAVRKDWPILAGILDKALDSIPDAERKAIYRKWLPVRYEHGLDYAHLWLVLAVFGLVVLGLTLWIRRLSNEITRRKGAETAARDSARRFRQLFDAAAVPMIFGDQEGNLLSLNARFIQDFGYTLAEMPTLADWWKGALPEPGYRRSIENRWNEAAARTRERGEDFRPIDIDIHCRNGALKSYVLTATFFGQDFIAGFVDLTERKQMELALKESERNSSELLEKMNEAQRIASVGSWEWHPQTGQVWWSDETYKIFALSPEHYAPDFETSQRFVHPEDLEKFVLAFRHSKATGEPLDLDFRGGAADGTLKHCQIKGRLSFDEAGRSSRFIGTVLDVTQRKQMELNLAHERTFLKTLIQTLPDPVWLKDPDGLYLACNPRFEALYGEPEAEIIGKTDYDFVGRQEADFFREKDRQAIANGGPSINEEQLNFASDGHRELVQTIKTPMVGSDGKLIGVLGIARDITAARKNEQELTKLALAVEQSQDCIVITNLDAEIEYVNEAFIRSTGWQREEIMGQNPRLLHSGKTPPETYAAMWDALTHGHSWQGELVNRRKNGEEYLERATIIPLRQADGQVTNYVAVKEDTTEKRRLARELDQHRHHLEELVDRRTAELSVAKGQAEAANRAKSAFLANMSHEIRTPMNAIVGLTHLLQRGKPSTEQAERLDKIDAASQHLLGIVNDILDLSKIEAGRLELMGTDFLASDIVESVANMVGDAARAKGLNVAIEHGDLPAWLHGDGARLRQALLNYASNAVKFTNQGGITLRSRPLEVHGGGLMIRFEVQDSGVGIPSGEIARLFEPFEQADASTTRAHGGTGLGLAITRRLAQLMGGDAGAESRPGSGSTFWFTAELKQAQAPAAQVAQEAPVDAERALRHRHGGTPVLLVEDNPINRVVALELLRTVKLNVEVAEDGQAAVEMAQRNNYALILMDIQMPRMDGLSATRAIRGNPALARIPIIAMTANAFGDDRKACAAAGMDDHIAKPVQPRALYEVILRHLQSGSHAADGELAADGDRQPGVASG
jgi:two-component system, sensor histidine kinase and response regulator